MLLRTSARAAVFAPRPFPFPPPHAPESFSGRHARHLLLQLFFPVENNNVGQNLKHSHRQSGLHVASADHFDPCKPVFNGVSTRIFLVFAVLGQLCFPSAVVPKTTKKHNSNTSIHDLQMNLPDSRLVHKENTFQTAHPLAWVLLDGFGFDLNSFEILAKIVFPCLPLL